METQELLNERGKTHGDYGDLAGCTQALKTMFKNYKRKDGSVPWNDFDSAERESLDMIAQKIGRILAGDSNFRDHWDDIAGYAKLVANRCTK